MTIIEKMGGRKFVFSVVVTILCFVLVLTNQIQSADFLKLLFGLVAVYSTSNVAQKVSLKKIEQKKD